MNVEQQQQVTTAHALQMRSRDKRIAGLEAALTRAERACGRMAADAQRAMERAAVAALVCLFALLLSGPRRQRQRAFPIRNLYVLNKGDRVRVTWTDDGEGPYDGTVHSADCDILRDSQEVVVTFDDLGDGGWDWNFANLDGVTIELLKGAPVEVRRNLVTGLAFGVGDRIVFAWPGGDVSGVIESFGDNDHVRVIGDANKHGYHIRTSDVRKVLALRATAAEGP